VKNFSTTLILLGGLFLLGCEPSGSSLRIGTNVWPGYEPLYVAQHEKRWDTEKIRLVEYPSASEVLRAFRNKALEGASLTADEVLLLREDRIPVKIVLIHDISDGGDVIIARNHIKSVKDLKGKKVGVESNALGAYVLSRALEIHGMKASDIQIIKIDINEQEKDFLNQKVDAVVTFEPVKTKLINQGGQIIFSSKEIKNEIVDVLVFHEDAIKNQKSLIQNVVNEWFWAVRLLNEKPNHASKIIARRLKITPEEVIQSFEGLHIPDRKENLQLFSEIEKSLQKINQVMFDNQLIKKKVEIYNLVTDEFIK